MNFHPLDCQKCKLCETRTQVVPSVIAEGSRVMFIGEAPGAEEDKKGIPFVGEAGKILNEALREVGIDRDEISIANICNCRPPENRPPQPKEIEACSEFLDQEIRELKPELLVLLGNTPLKKFLKGVGGITRVRGKWFDSEEYNCKLYPVFHPAYILRNPQEKSKLVNDLKQVKNFLDGNLFTEEKIPTDYKVAYNIKQFDWIIDQLNQQELWSFDTETTGLDFDKDDIFILTFSWQEATAVLIDLRLFEDKEYIWNKLKETFENNSKKVAQNGSFDIEFLLSKDIVVKNYYCDTILCHYLLNENSNHGLEILAEEYTDLRGYDQPLQQYILQNKIDNYSNIPPEILHPYALTDADVTLRCYNKMLPKIYEEGLDFVLFNIMMPIQKILIQTEYQGISIDIPYLEKTIIKYEKEISEYLQKSLQASQVKEYAKDKQQEIISELRKKWENSKTLVKRFPNFDDYLKEQSEEKITFEFNVNSSKQLKELLIEKMKLPILKKTKKDGPCLDEEVLQEYAKRNKFCEYLARYRSLSHLKSTFLDGIKERLEGDKVHTDYLLFSTVCISENSKIYTNKGFFYAKDLVPKGKPGELLPLLKDVKLCEGTTFRKPLGCMDNGIKDTIVITIENGETIEGTPEHCVLCVNPSYPNNSYYGVWRRLDNLKIGDTLFYSPIINHHKEIKSRLHFYSKKVLKIEKGRGRVVDFTMDPYPEETQGKVICPCCYKPLYFISIHHVKLHGYNNINKFLLDYPNTKLESNLKKINNKKFGLLEVSHTKTPEISERSRKVALRLKSEGKFCGDGTWKLRNPEKAKIVNKQVSKTMLKYFREHPDWLSQEKRKKISDNTKRMNRLGLTGGSKTPNGIESILLENCINLIEYTGNGKVWIDFSYKMKNPDFVVKNDNQKVIEVFGDYWHKDDVPEELINEYRKQGVNCLIIWENDIRNNLENTIKRVQEFCSVPNCRRYAFLANGFICHNTGRPSSRNPNLNNIPRTGTAEDIKDIFCSDKHEDGTNDWLIEVDGGQMEFRMWINYSKDPQALEDLNEGIDVHKLIAASAYHGILIPKGHITYKEFKEIVKDVTKEERQYTKNIIFGLMYGRGAKSVAEQLGISVVMAQKIINIFFDRYKIAKKWLDIIVAIAKRDGYVTSIFGRKRRLLNIKHPQDSVRAEAERQAKNSPVQSAASDLTFLACISSYNEGIMPNRLKSRLVLTVYDSLVFNVPDEELEYTAKLLYNKMSISPIPEIIVPLVPDIKIGKNWGSLMDVDITEDWNIIKEKLNQKFVLN